MTGKKELRILFYKGALSYDRKKDKSEVINKKINAEKEKIKRYEKEIQELQNTKQLILAKNAKEEEKKKLKEKIFVGNCLINQMEKGKISYQNMEQIINMIFTENNEDKMKLITILKMEDFFRNQPFKNANGNFIFFDFKHGNEE